MQAKEIEKLFLSLANPSQAQHLSRFFKTGEGEYGYGDKFLGIRVPETRSIVKKYKTAVSISDCISLIKSEWHEIRLAGFLLLIELYRSAKKHGNDAEIRNIVNTYIDHIPYSNNWDLVDLVCPYILGDWLVGHPEERGILYEFADRDDSLWHQRVAIVSTFALIRASSFDDTIRISKKFLTHNHDLIHKATGWMLREMGKRGGNSELLAFLEEHATSMPRTALRYSIERFPEPLRQYYLKKKNL